MYPELSRAFAYVLPYRICQCHRDLHSKLAILERRLLTDIPIYLFHEGRTDSAEGSEGRSVLLQLHGHH